MPPIMQTAPLKKMNMYRTHIITPSPARIYVVFSSSGSFAIFTAIRLASSLLSNFAAERRPTGWLIF
jgi:hypothetical protein